ncbi:phage Gp37Gp68 [Roseibium sp. TrichSKD4]|uniref:DUF5131 family protein n=1 Tax=Roseibium sp. TrichSKD4 TaxID=744980 RepID=UPI0001E5639A|nr:phage Gp37/Gp68 family protein [Roseibium sp. TrichSKD4]EFO33924.1 phage Gp37Gp68 [Roseibium sp. TrichSKD4]
MAETSQIEWTDATWNPVTGCTLVSEGCRNCYAAELAATRLKNHPSREGLARKNADGVAKFTGEIRVNRDWLYQPMGWRKPRRIFVCAHSDLFHEGVPDEVIDKVFAVMALTPHHTYQVLTKRPERMRDYLLAENRDCDVAEAARHIDPKRAGKVLEGFGNSEEPSLINKTWPLPNVWLGVSIEDQATADTRIPYLLKTPAAVRFLSAEPLLGPVDLTAVPYGVPVDGVPSYQDAMSGKIWMPGGTVPWATNVRATANGRTNVDLCGFVSWVIVGGESGRKARPMHPDWVRSIRDQCEAAAVAFFFKQWGGWSTVFDRDVEDPDWGHCSEIKRRTPKGRWLNLEGGHGFHGERVVRVDRRGKKASGRLLDGVLHDGMPDLGGAS